MGLWGTFLIQTTAALNPLSFGEEFFSELFGFGHQMDMWSGSSRDADRLPAPLHKPGSNLIYFVSISLLGLFTEMAVHRVMPDGY